MTDIQTSRFVLLLASMQQTPGAWPVAQELLHPHTVKSLFAINIDQQMHERKLWSKMSALCTPVFDFAFARYLLEQEGAKVDWIDSLRNKLHELSAETGIGLDKVRVLCQRLNEDVYQAIVVAGAQSVKSGDLTVDEHIDTCARLRNEMLPAAVDIMTLEMRRTERVAARRAGRRVVSTFVPSGFPTLDDAIGGGFRVGDFSLITAGTGVGKSQLVSAIARNLLWANSSRATTHGDSEAERERRATWLGHRLMAAPRPGVRALVLLGSDMTVDEIEDRIEADMLGFHTSKPDSERQVARGKPIAASVFDRLTSGVVDIWDAQEIGTSMGRPHAGLDIGVVEQAVTLWAQTTRADAVAVGSEPPKLLVMLDYLQQVTVDPKVAKTEGQIPNDTWRLAYVAKRLRILASTLGVALVCTAQLNGRVGRQTAEENSLRGSAGPEHEAALVLSLDAVSKLERRAAKGTADQGLVDFAASLLRVTAVKGRNIGHADDVFLAARLDYGCRVLELTGDDHTKIQQIGDPIAKLRADIKAATTANAKTKRAREPNSRLSSDDTDAANPAGLA